MHSNKKFISILITNMESGGAEKVTLSLANYFARNGYTVDLVLVSATGELLSMLDPKVKIIDLNVKSLKYAVFPLIKYFIKNNPVACFVNIWPLTIIAILARMVSFSKLKLIVCEHTTWSESEVYKHAYFRAFIPISMKLMYRFAHKIICVSKGSAGNLSQFAQINRKKIEVIYNPVEKMQSIKPLSQTLCSEWLDGDHKRLIAVGSLKPAKDYPTLFKSIHLLKKDLDIKLLVLGDGPLSEDLIKLRKDLRLTEEIIMPGYEKYPHEYIASADVLVLSSKHEGFGNVIVEALSEGTPVVSTDCPYGPSEIISSAAFGTLANIQDPVSLARAINTSLGKSFDKKFLKERAKYFSIERAAKKYLQTIN